MDESSFPVWLREQMDQHHWNQSDLGRASGVTSAAISRLLSGERNPGADVCSAFAKAFGYPPELVFRKAGLLPAAPDWPDWRESYAELLHLFDQLSPDDQEEIIAIARLKFQRKQEHQRNA